MTVPRAILAILVISLTLIAVPASAQAPQATQSAYAGAAACKTCHAAIYEAWQRTKHAHAIDKLAASDRKGDACIRCHVTGAPEQIAAEGAKPSHPNVQCEACHGAAAAHAAEPTVKTGLARKPGESACTGCHNDQSPHFHGFVYAAMSGFAHPQKN
jgi:hypothetical protein